MLRIVSCGCATSVAVVPTVYYGCVWEGDIVVLNFEGSSSMRPLMEYLLYEYSKTDKKIAFNVSSIGSGSGLQKLLNSDTEFALVSHDVSKLPQDSKYKDLWKQRSIKHIVLAEESMVILYKPDSRCTQELKISKDNIVNFYGFFSGHKPNWKNTQSTHSFKDLLPNSTSSSVECDFPLHVWVKSTGPTKSGTAKAFVDNPLLDSECSNSHNQSECETWRAKVREGYGQDYQMNYVPESTNLHWSNFYKNLKPGAITYLPSHFVFQNWDQIKSAGIKLAQYDKQLISNNQDFTFSKDSLDTIQNIKWKRSFNLLYSTHTLQENVQWKNIVKFLVTQKEHIKQIQLIAKEYKIKDDSSSSAGGEEIDLCQADEN